MNKTYLLIMQLLFSFFLIITPNFAQATDTTIVFTADELEWINAHQSSPLYLGFDPYTGMDYFDFQGEKQGYIIDLVNLLEEETGLNIELIDDRSWGEVYNGLFTGDIDILLGANITPERLKIMSFTEPIHKYPYAIFARTDSSVKTLGDLDHKSVGFIEGDIAIDLFKQEFKKINFNVIEFPDQLAGLKSLNNGGLSGLITSGGGIKYEFTRRYPGVRLLTEIEDITSDMTLSTTLENATLANILDRVIKIHGQNSIKQFIKKAEITYNRKILNLTDDDITWLNSDTNVAIIGIASDYLPFDHYDDGVIKGIDGEIFKSIGEIIGMRFEYVYDDFDTIYNMALEGDVHIINIAKTENRLSNFYFTRSFSDERDEIYGKKLTPSVSDIYGLEEKNIAVIKGFWHKEHLLKNLRNVHIIETDNIQESLDAVEKGRADYFIENPTVAEFYINGLDYHNIKKKGTTSKDSFLHFGITIHEPEIASILDKTLPFVNYEIAKQNGLDTVPELVSKSIYYLATIIFVLVLVLGVIIFILIRSFRALIREKEESAVLKAKEYMMYHDSLTNLNNRHYYNHIAPDLDTIDFPQCVIIADLNSLKYVNDTMGHHMGDAYIKTFGKLIEDLFPGAITCRMGGDEFLIIKAECDDQCADQLVSALIRQSDGTSITLGQHKIEQIGIAVGYHIRESEKDLIDSAIIQADNNMYTHKKLYKRHPH